MNPISACHMLIGPPGSGKSTVAQHLQQLLPGSCLISTDQIRQQLYGNEAYQGDWNEISAQVKTAITAALQANQAVIYDATNARRPWRMTFLQEFSGAEPWVGWHLTTPLRQCQQWNQQRDRAVPRKVIDQMHQALHRFPPLAGEGFDLVQTLDPSPHQGRLPAVLKAKLNALPRSLVNRVNRTQYGDLQLHGYSALLDFDRLTYLISLLVRFPGLGHLHHHDPELLQQLLSSNAAVVADSLDELCTVLAKQYGDLYADPEAITQDLHWLEQNGFLSPQSTTADLTLPPPRYDRVSTHAYSDWESFRRLLVTLRFISHHPFYWNTQDKGGLDSLIRGLAEQGLLTGDHSGAIRRDIERVLKPLGILPGFTLRRGYFIGSGVLSESQLLQVAQLLQSQAKSIQDPVALNLVEVLQERLQRSRHDLEDLYPVRVTGNRPIVNAALLPAAALACNPEQLEQEIETGQLLELKHFAGSGVFDQVQTDFFLAWPLQIVFHNIAWYLGFEVASGENAGLLKFDRLDRLFRGQVQGKSRTPKQQRRALTRLQGLYAACGSLYLGKSAALQTAFLKQTQGRKQRPDDKASSAEITLELWCTDQIFRFISEGTQRFPAAQMKMSPKVGKQKSQPTALFCLERSPDPHYPNRLQVRLPVWCCEDVELRRWILGFGALVKVVSPVEMQRSIYQIGQDIVEVYRS